MEICASTNHARTTIIRKIADVLREERATATNIESAIDKAGVDRDAVNTTFGSMHGLFLEMVSDLSAALMQPLETYPRDRTLQDVLIEFGNAVANAYSVSHLIALYRIALTETTRKSSTGKEFFERGPGKLTLCLAQYLESSTRRFSHLRIDNPKRVADTFLSLLEDNLDLLGAMSATRISSAQDHNDAVIKAVELLCHGIVTEEQGCRVV